MMALYTILGVHINNRVTNSGVVQEVLTKFGCSIKTRLGLHKTDEVSCSSDGLLILEVVGNQKEIDDLEKALRDIKGINVQKMIF